MTRTDELIRVLNYLAGGTINANEALVQKFTDLADYFSLAPGGRLDQRKGIALLGPPGTGKTLVMKALQYLARHGETSFIKINALLILDRYKESGELIHANAQSNVFYDDIGQFKTAVFYGQKADISNELFLRRYEVYVQGFKTHITTNQSVQDFSESISAAAFSRAIHMFNFVEFDFPDQRPTAKMGNQITVDDYQHGPSFFESEERRLHLEMKETYERMKVEAEANKDKAKPTKKELFEQMYDEQMKKIAERTGKQ